MADVKQKNNKFEVVKVINKKGNVIKYGRVINKSKRFIK